MSKEFEGSGKPVGRPKKGEGPHLPYEEIDRLLVFGELVLTSDGKSKTVVYPSYRELAQRYGVAHSLIADYGRRHNCLRRRNVARARVEEQTDQRLVELRAKAQAVSRDQVIRIIDTYLAGFERALAEGRVRSDNASDFNMMVRLKEFMVGGADSRHVHTVLSLADLQARHRRMLKIMEVGDSPKENAAPLLESGQQECPEEEIGGSLPEPVSDDDVEKVLAPPPLAFQKMTTEVPVHFLDKKEAQPLALEKESLPESASDDEVEKLTGQVSGQFLEPEESPPLGLDNETVEMPGPFLESEE